MDLGGGGEHGETEDDHQQAHDEMDAIVHPHHSDADGDHDRNGEAPIGVAHGRQQRNGAGHHSPQYKSEHDLVREGTGMKQENAGQPPHHAGRAGFCHEIRRPDGKIRFAPGGGVYEGPQAEESRPGDDDKQA